MMYKTYLRLIALTLLMTWTSADVSISGDARVRPRLDVKTYGKFGSAGSEFKDVYYLYRARILITADIGNNYYFKTRLGHNGVAYWVGKFGTGATPSGSSIAGAGRGSVDFMELYFGHQGRRFSWSAGLIPVSHNPLIDLHFYPKAPMDIPWVIFSNSAAHGFDLNYKLAGNNLDLKILVDNNTGNAVVDQYFVETIDTTYSYYLDPVDGTVKHDTTLTVTVPLDAKTRDQYTFNLTYPLVFSGLKITPELLMTVADSGKAAPLTYGASIGLPRVAGFKVSAYYGLTRQTVTDAGAYTGWIGRIKLLGSLGPGKLTAWYDRAQTTPDLTDAITTDFSYLWISYTYVLHKSEKGALTIAPTYRLVTEKTKGSTDYSRAKIEVTTQITFK